MIEITTILMTVLATDEKNTTNYAIASYIMNNLSMLQKTQNLTTGFLAKQCNVSKASISRFCRDVGIEDFYTFKYLLKNFYPQNTMTKKYAFSKDVRNIQGDFLEELDNSIQYFKHHYDKNLLDELTNDLHQYKTVVLMGHQQSFAMALTLQNDLGTAFSKFTLVCGEPNRQAEFFQNGTSEDLFIVFSATGHFFDHALIKPKLVRKKNLPKTYLITVNPEANYSFVYKTVCLGNGYNYPSTILMNIYIGMISTNYCHLLSHK